MQIPPPEVLVASGPVFLSDSLWLSCTHLARNATSTRGAIAFAGKDAAELLPLRPGDEIVVDASDARLQAGATNPEGIAGWLGQGARVYSVEALHAKVLRFTLENGPESQQLTVVGSGNVSASSAENLIEAALLVDDEETAATVDELIDQLIAEAGAPLDSAWLEHARSVYRPPAAPEPIRRRPGAFPASERPLWVITSEERDEPQSDELDRAVVATRLDYGSDVWVYPIQLHAGDEVACKPGDGVIVGFVTDPSKESDGRWSAYVGRFVRILPHDDERPEAVLALDLGYRHQTWKAIGRVFEEHATDNDDGDDPVQPGTELHAALLAMWRRRERS